MHASLSAMKWKSISVSLHPISVLLVSALSSLLVATDLRCHQAQVFFLEAEFSSLGTPNEFRWLGFATIMFSHLMVPVCAGVIDTFRIRYRVSIAVSGLTQLLGCVISAGIQDPGYLIITDTLICGIANAGILATVILVIDDYFDETSPLRILATTLVQGSSIGTFFFVNAYASLLHSIGWRAVYYAVGVTQFSLSLLGAALFLRKTGSSPEYDLIQSDDDSVIDNIRAPGEWRKQILGITQAEFDRSKTVMLWLMERLMVCLITDGTFFFLLKTSQMIPMPLVNSKTHSPGTPHVVVAFLFSVGASSTYIVGGFVGCLLVGNLLVVYMVASLLVFCSLIGWISVTGEDYNLELVFSCLCGLNIGCLNTFAYAASQEATGIKSRHIFPFTKMLTGLSCIILQISILVLNEFKSKPFLVILVLTTFAAIGEFVILVLIRRITLRKRNRSIRRLSRKQGDITETLVNEPSSDTSYQRTMSKS